jgi:hypothetical protein
MKVVFILLFLICSNLFSQNLVPNPSFEFFSECPNSNGIQGANLASPWYGVQNDADYYNLCSTTFYTVPFRTAGDFQQPMSGVGYTGIFCYSLAINNGREYIQAPLTNNLVANNFYYIKFFVNMHNSSKYSTNNLGINFSPNPLSAIGNDDLISSNNQIVKFGNPVIKDTLNWIVIDGIYRAIGNESFVTIGNFNSDQETIKEIMPIENQNVFGAYYFIDDVSLEEITVPFWSYHDTLVNYGDSVLIGPALTGLDVDWYTDNMEFISNGPGIYVSPATSRNYIAKETFNGVETEHNVYVTVIGGVGLEENTLQKIEVYPNPSKGNFSISGIKSESPLHLEVRDVHGKLVFESQNLSKEVNSFHLNVEDGIYFVNITNLKTHETSVKKLVVRK